MTSSKIKKDLETHKKLDGILSASKLKVLNKMSTVKKAASHSYMTALLSKKIFEFASEKYGFDTEIYANDFNTNKNINIIFIDEKQTLSHAFERTIKAFLTHRKDEDINYIVTNDKIEDERLEGIPILDFDSFLGLSYEITNRYVTKKYDFVNIYSALSKNNEPITILPISKLEEDESVEIKTLINKGTDFTPSLEYVIEKSFLDYVKSLMQYFFINGRYINLKNTLLKHESSLDHVTEKIEELKKQANKIRQAKLTEEILLSYQGVDDE